MSSTAATPQSPAIEYPDSDGEPMAENTLQFKWIVTIKEGLDGVYRYDPNVFVAGDLFWYPVEGHPEIRLAPDTLVAFGRPKGRRGSYKQWEEGGIAPQVIFEVLSPGNRPPEMANKFAFYERHGVDEYYIYDPDTGDLAGWLRRAGRLEPVPDMDGFVSPLLGVRFEPGEGPDNLVIIGPNGRPLLAYVEVLEERDAAEQRAAQEQARAAWERERADQERERAAQERGRADQEQKQAAHERARAEQERERAEQERGRAEQERDRAERLAAKLREFGIDPDQA